MDDPELEAMRQKRLAELRAQGSSGGGSAADGVPASVLAQLGKSGVTGAGAVSGGGDDDGKTEQEEELRRTLVSQILSPDARDRLSRISLVRPQRARAIQDLLIRMAQGGQLKGRVSEDQLIGVLDQVERQEKGVGGGGGVQGKASGGKITYKRKDAYGDDDFDL